MKISPVRRIFAASVGVLLTCVPAWAENLYVVGKTQVFFQTSATGSVPDPLTPFLFSAHAPTNVTLAYPSGATTSMTFNGSDEYAVTRAFATQTALDAAFPNGTYQMSGGAIPTLSFPATTNLYPSSTLQVTGGTWNSGGVLVVDAANPGTLTFTNFDDYGHTGVASHMNVEITGVFDNVDQKREVASQPVFGITQSNTPITSYTISTGSLTVNNVYLVEVTWDAVSALDANTISNGGVITLFSKRLRFYLAPEAVDVVVNGQPVYRGPVAATISNQPTNQTASPGGNATFSVTALFNGGATPGATVSYRWYFNGFEINPDNNKYTSTGSTLTVHNVSTADTGSYLVRVIDAGGVTTSNAATLSLTSASAPAITTQPVYQTVTTGATATFSVTATGSAPLTYQWRKDGSVINGATTSTLSLTNVISASAGNYSVVVTNSSGSVTSDAARLTVLPATGSPTARLINLSVLRDGGDGVTMGFVIRGTGTKKMVLRGVGPGLALVGVTSGYLPDPRLELFEKSTSLQTNDDWGGTQALRDAFAAVGAFSLDDNSKDAAIARSLSGDDYSAKITGAPGTSGLTIVEAYDADAGGNGIRLVNLSALANVNKDKPLTAGFVIRDGPKTLLLRAVGPGLATVGVTSGFLVDPRLTLYAGQNQILVNEDWGGSNTLKAAFSTVGAFNLAADNSKDAVILVTLNPGDYSVGINATGSDAGLAIVEIYEMP